MKDFKHLLIKTIIPLVCTPKFKSCWIFVVVVASAEGFKRNVSDIATFSNSYLNPFPTPPST